MSNETKEVKIPVEILPGTVVEALEKSRKVKNSEEVRTSYLLMIEPKDVVSLLTRGLDKDGGDVFANAVIRELIIPACHDASAEAIKVDPASGESVFDEDVFTQCFWANFVPASRGGRGGGTKVADLRNRVQELTPEFTELAGTAGMLAQKGEKLSEEQYNRFQQLLLEIQQLNRQIEEKSRGGAGRPKGKKKNAAKDSAGE